MPTYEYYCAGCETTEEVFLQRPVDGISFPPRSRQCATCTGIACLAPSLPSPPEIRFAPRWHRGIGARVSSTREVNEIAKKKGLTYVGRDHGD